MERQLSDCLLFAAGQQNQTSRGLFVMIHFLGFSTHITVVKWPSNHSSVVPPAEVTLLITFVCKVPGATRATSSLLKEQAAMKAVTIVSSTW